MGWNTVVLLYNDMADMWPKEIWHATASLRRVPRSIDERGWFRFGQVASTDHADGTQIVVAGRNAARRVTCLDPAEQEDLDALSEVLRAHGYSVRAPGEKRAQSPLRWGYWASQNRTEPKRESATPAPETATS
jgi:hypothetical protein